MIYRDLNPRNVLVSEQQEYKLCDFGVAKAVNDATNRGLIVTWHYISPEIFRGDVYNQSCNVYSFGIMMHEIFTLCPPYFTSSIEFPNYYDIWARIENGYRSDTRTNMEQRRVRRNLVVYCWNP